jgi:hypothetical protein
MNQHDPGKPVSFHVDQKRDFETSQEGEEEDWF